MNKIIPAFLAAAVGLGGWWLWSQRGGYDYEAAFENLPAADPSADWPLADFAGKPREQAEGVLGRAQGCEPSLHSERCRYAGGVEIVYIDDRADWITISFPYGSHVLDADALLRLGLPARAPSEQDEHSLIWHELPGLAMVQIVGDENGVLFARVKVRHV
jgi:hypothetical protein